MLASATVLKERRTTIMTYSKVERETEIYHLISGEQSEAEDSGKNRFGTNALEEFKAHDIIHAEEGTLLIPFHAVDHIESRLSAKEEERKDPYCKDDESAPTVGHFEGLSHISVNQGIDIDLTSGVKAYDAEGNEVSFTVSPDSIDSCTVGHYEVKYTSVDAEATRTVTVKQIEHPIIHGLTDEEEEVGVAFDALFGVTAIDGNGNEIAVTTDPANPVYTEAGEYKLKYIATDACGNETVAYRNITVIDTAMETVLYSDGTFIINELAADREQNIQMYGDVIRVYDPLTADNPYVFDSRTDQPWINESEYFYFVKFGSKVAPTSLAYWFQRTSIGEIDWENFDGSNCTTIRAFASGTYLSEVTLPPMPNLTSLRYAFRGCEALWMVDFSQVGTKSLNDMTDCFQGCYGLGEVDLSGLGGTVISADRAFANIAGDGMGDMNIYTIYGSEDLVFTAGSSMFRSCTSLTGGAGTTFDPNKTNYTMAHIDTVSNPGYFRKKN